MDTGVLIVGTGPTGLMLAKRLARRRVRSLIVDRHAGLCGVRAGAAAIKRYGSERLRLGTAGA